MDNKFRKKRPKKPLTREMILKRAMKMADQQGLEKLSMRKLAGKLGVEAMSLYNHVKNKDDILDGIVDLIFLEVEWPMEVDWKEAMRERSLSIRQVIKKHPWAIHILESRPNPGPITLGYHDRVIKCLRQANFSLRLTSHAFSTLDAFTFGFVMQEQALPFETEDELKIVADEILNSFPKQMFPNLFELTSEYILQTGYSYANEFLFGLELVIDGLDRQFQIEQASQ